MVKFYSSIDDLKSKIIAAMYQAIINTPAVGWIRADKVVSSPNDDLMERVKSLERNQIIAVPVGDVQNYHRNVGVTANLPIESINLLLEIAKDPYGQIDIIKTLGGTFYSTNGQHLNEDGFGKEVAFWENAIDHLISNGYAKYEYLENDNKIVKLTMKGYNFVEQLDRKNKE